MKKTNIEDLKHFVEGDASCPDYYAIDFFSLKLLAIKIFKKNNGEVNGDDWLHFFNITEDDLK